jgi:hypothetical protein
MKKILRILLEIRRDSRNASNILHLIHKRHPPTGKGEGYISSMILRMKTWS